MSFAQHLTDSADVAALNTASQGVTVYANRDIVAATPAGVAVGSALVAAAWTGAQVGDVAD